MLKENKPFQSAFSLLLGMSQQYQEIQMEFLELEGNLMVTLIRDQRRGHKAEKQVCLWEIIFQNPRGDEHNAPGS